MTSTQIGNVQNKKLPFQKIWRCGNTLNANAFFDMNIYLVPVLIIITAVCRLIIDYCVDWYDDVLVLWTNVFFIIEPSNSNSNSNAPSTSTSMAINIVSHIEQWTLNIEHQLNINWTNNFTKQYPIEWLIWWFIYSPIFNLIHKLLYHSFIISLRNKIVQVV